MRPFPAEELWILLTEVPQGRGWLWPSSLASLRMDVAASRVTPACVQKEPVPLIPNTAAPSTWTKKVSVSLQEARMTTNTRQKVNGKPGDNFWRNHNSQGGQKRADLKAGISHSTPLVKREIYIKTTVRYHFIACRRTKIKDENMWTSMWRNWNSHTQLGRR